MMSQHSTEKGRRWLLPDERKADIKPGLYIASTPIGNMTDISVRALNILSAADLVVCEDTRVSGKLLNYYGISVELMAYNDYNAAPKRARIIKKLEQGKIVALISDAGTPLISDPGFKLVQDVVERNIYVTSLPGANAPLTALQLSGLPSDKFSFLGFLPPKQVARKKALESWNAVPSSLVIFESAPRLLATLKDIREVLGERKAAVVREMTKMFEESRRDDISDLIGFYEEKGKPKGEIVIVVAPGDKKEATKKEMAALLREELKKTKSTREAAAAVAEKTGKPRKMLYDMALDIQEADREKNKG